MPLLTNPLASIRRWAQHCGQAVERHCAEWARAYLQISLARLAPHAGDYLATGNVLAGALASIMGRSLRGAERARLYYGCLRRLMEAEQVGEVSRATRELLGDVVETYLPGSAEDRAALRRQLEAEGGDLMALEAIELTWRSRADLEAPLRTRRGDIRPSSYI